jgi:hypothetical protein
MIFRLSLDTRKSRLRLQQLATTSLAAAPPASGLSVEHLRQIIRRVERDLESPLIEMDTANVSEQPTKLSLSDNQIRMAMWLNKLRAEKVVTWWPDVPNSHAVAIVR